MENVSTIHGSVPTRAPSGLGNVHEDICAFAVGVGGVRNGDTVVVVNPAEGLLLPRLKEIGAKVRRAEGCEFCDSHPLPMASSSVDVIFAAMVLHHIRYPTQAIAEMKRVLKPGGRLVMMDLGKYNDQRLKAARKDRWMGFYTSDIRHWLRKTGFSNIIVNSVPYRVMGFDMKRLEHGATTDIFLATGTA